MSAINDYSVWVDQYVGHWLSQTCSPTLPPDPTPPHSENRKRKRVDEKGEPVSFHNHYPDTDTFIPKKASYSEHSSDAGSSCGLPGTSYKMDSVSGCDSPGSIASVTSKTSIKRKLEALEFNGTPALAWHLMPDDLPNPVAKLMNRLALSGDGYQSIPLSLKETIEADLSLVSEAFSPFLWTSSISDPDIAGPNPADTRLWEFVQDIVRHSRLLASQNAEESEYYPLVQKILRLNLNRSVRLGSIFLVAD